MALWDKLKTELDRAGRVAQSALDEGKLRLEILRVRQLADKAAQALGYAVYRARKDGHDLDAETYARLSSTLAAHEAEAQRMETQLESARAARGEATTPPSGSAAGPEAGTGGASAGATDHVDPAMGDSRGAGPGAPGSSGTTDAGGGSTGGAPGGGTSSGGTSSGGTSGGGYGSPGGGPYSSGGGPYSGGL